MVLFQKNSHSVKYYLTVSLIVFLTLVIDAQNDNSFLFTEVKCHYGFILPHHETMRYLQKGHIPAFELRIGKTSSGKYLWEKLFRMPEYGFGFYFADLQWEKVLGKVYAVNSWFSIPILKNDKFLLNYGTACGIAYLTKHFDENNNYYNIAIGSHFNAFLNLNITAKYKLSDNCKFSNSINLTHYSNGAIKTPNLGINVVSYSIGLQYTVKHFQHADILKSENIVRKNLFNVLYSFGFKDISPSVDKEFYASTLSFNIERFVSQKYKAGLGLDIFYDASTTETMKRLNKANIQEIDKYKSGIHFSFNPVFGKTTLILQMGTYVFYHWNKDGLLYHRFGLQYFINKHLIINLTLKTHFGAADYIESGFGYSF